MPILAIHFVLAHEFAAEIAMHAFTAVPASIAIATNKFGFRGIPAGIARSAIAIVETLFAIVAHLVRAVINIVGIGRAGIASRGVKSASEQ